jgi:hypothetical protein
MTPERSEFTEVDALGADTAKPRSDSASTRRALQVVIVDLDRFEDLDGTTATSPDGFGRVGV